MHFELKLVLGQLYKWVGLLNSEPERLGYRYVLTKTLKAVDAFL